MIEWKLPQNFQIQDADLSSIEGIADNSSGFLEKIAPNTWQVRQLASGDIPGLDAENITTGIFNIARIPTGATDSSVSLGNHNHSLNTLSDANFTGLASGNFPRYNGIKWVNTILGAEDVPSNLNATSFSGITLTNMDGGIRIKSNTGTAGYGVLLRNDNANFYILFTAANNANGSWAGSFPFTVNFTSRNITLGSTTPSTSTTTGSIISPGGAGFGGALFAQSLNGQLVLNRYTTATRPAPSASTQGQVWYNTDTNNIEFATSSTIRTITST